MSESDIEALERGLETLSEDLSVNRREYRVTFDFLLYDSENQFYNLFGFGRSSVVYKNGSVTKFTLRLPTADPVVKQRVKDIPLPTLVHDRPSNLRPALHIKSSGRDSSYISDSYNAVDFMWFVKRVCEIYEE